MSKQINQMSKREILESLYQEQNQSNATLSRLFTAVARALEIAPDKLAEIFSDDKANQEYANKFNEAMKARHATEHNHDHPPTS